ncbi:MAG: membrane protein insertion efficiency factor YidD [Actinomycetota bacterium]
MSLVRALGWPFRAVLLGLLAVHRRVLSPVLGARCRFHPSCSAYAAEAIRTHGAAKGSVLAAWRVARCSPLSAGGVEPVPPRGRWRTVSDNVIHTRGAG